MAEKGTPHPAMGAAERVERLKVIRARIRRSIDDPRPDLTEEEVDALLEAFHREMMKAHGAV